VQAVAWFDSNFGMVYDASSSGSPSDWLLDLVSVNFANSANTVGFRSDSELEQAADVLLKVRPGTVKVGGVELQARGKHLRTASALKPQDLTSMSHKCCIPCPLLQNIHLQTHVTVQHSARQF
jgi:hypothetical protein